MHLDDLSDEVILGIFSYFSNKELQPVGCVSHRFFDISKDRQVKICRKIENDANYNPTISNKELMNLVCDEQGNPRHIPRRSTLAIKPSAYSTDKGKLYEINIACKGPMDDSEFSPSIWHIDSSATILVRNNGKVEFYRTEEVAENNFQNLLTHLELDRFLDWPCLQHDHSEATNLGL